MLCTLQKCYHNIRTFVSMYTYIYIHIHSFIYVPEPSGYPNVRFLPKTTIPIPKIDLYLGTLETYLEDQMNHKIGAIYCILIPPWYVDHKSF